MSAGLLDERVVMAQPSLIRAVGLPTAVVVQQVHYHAVYREGTEDLDGYRWWPITVAAFAEEVGFTADSMRRVLAAAEAEGLLVTCQPEGWSSRRKWYRVDRDAVNRQVGETAASMCADSPDANRADSPVPNSADSPNPPSRDRETQESSRERASSPTKRTTSRATTSGKSTKRLSDARADPLTREWWERQDPRPAQAFVAARGVVSHALKAGWSEEQLRAVLQRCDAPLSGGRLDFVRSRMGQSTRAEDQGWSREEHVEVEQR